MVLRFTGTFEQLQEKLRDLNGQGEWLDLNENQKQFRHNDGGILNWYPSTGTINFQGRGDGVGKLVADVETAIVTSLKVPLPSKTSAETSVDLNGTPIKGITVTAGLESQSMASRNGSPALEIDNQFLGQKFTDSELVIGLVGAVGTALRPVIDVLEGRLKTFGYTTQEVRVSKDIIPEIISVSTQNNDEYSRTSSLMNAGNQAREKTGDNSILALGVAAKISSTRSSDENSAKHRPRQAYIINSLKHPEEVARLREIYPEGFCLVGVYSDEKRRHDYLTGNMRMSPEQANELMNRDEDEHLPHGQRTSDTFHLSDFFVRVEEDHDKLQYGLWRILNILFGHPYETPTFDEYAMFMAFSAALRSADLSRQVGAVIARNNEIIGTGANDCPKYGGGLYWPEYDSNTHLIQDTPDGRDYKRQEDSNKIEQQKIIDDILDRIDEHVVNGEKEKLREVLQKSRIADITEYGRMVHAEMEALLSCARSSMSTRAATLYCTTFPCHNCAKHIVAAGITRVVYVEPYPKSKAAEFHSDSIRLGFSEKNNTVHFEPFVGVGPRRFFDLFSMRLGSGYPLRRKDAEGQVVKWQPEKSKKLRIQMLPCSYIELEDLASTMFNEFRKRKENAKNA
jgi:deoxycytidylate deaminase